MRLASESERRDLERLELLYVAGAAHTPVASLTILLDASVDLEDAQRWLLGARRRGLCFEFEPGLTPEDQLTQTGQTLVESARQRRGSPSYIRNATLSRVLGWADTTGGGNVTSFLASEYAWIDGIAPSFEQVAEAVVALHGDRLVKANVTTAWGGDVVRADVYILPAGRDVVDDFDGDVRAWRRSRAAPAQTVTIHSNHGAVAVGSNNSTVTATSNGLDADGVAALVEALAAARGVLGLSANDEIEYKANLAILRDSDEPGRVRRAVTWFARLGTDVGANALGTILAAQAAGLLG